MSSIIKAAYLATKTPEKKVRYDIQAKWGEYPMFSEVLLNKRGFNKGGLSLNYGPRPDKFKCSPSRAADKCISRNGNISSVYFPIPELPYAWGDIHNPKTKKVTQDALLFIFSPDEREIIIFVIEGERSRATLHYQSLCDGLLDDFINPIIHELRNP